MLDPESADSRIARVRNEGMLDSTNVVLAVLLSDPTSGQPNGGAAVAVGGVPRVFVRPLKYIFAVDICSTCPRGS
jgi:hypothetical protein